MPYLVRGITAVGSAATATAGLAVADVALLGYDMYQGYRLAQAYGYFLPKTKTKPIPMSKPQDATRRKVTCFHDGEVFQDPDLDQLYKICHYRCSDGTEDTRVSLRRFRCPTFFEK